MTTSAGSAAGKRRHEQRHRKRAAIIHGYFYGNYADENMKTDNVDDDLRAHGLTVGTYTIKQFDAVPALGGPIKKDKLWFFTSGENSMVNRSRAGVYYNATPLGWVYTPDVSRGPAPNKNTDTDKGLRLTWQASPRNKISAFWSQQIHTYHHRNSDESANSATSSAPESTNFTEEWPNFVSSLVWKSPISNKLLVEAGWGVNATHSDAASRDRATAWIRGASSRRPTRRRLLLPRLRRQRCGGWSQPFNHSQNQRASAAYVTGSHAFKVGFQGRTGTLVAKAARARNIRTG